MRGTVKKGFAGFLAVLVLTLVIFGAAMLSGAPSANAAQPAVPAKPEQALAPSIQQPDNQNCLACHGSPDQVHEFQNGDVVSISVDPEVYSTGKHANLACTTCHTNISAYPHPENAADSARAYTLQYQNTCAQCHPGQTEAITDSAHANLPADQQANAPTCADCHDPHTQPDIVTDENGDPVAAERP